MGRLNSYPSLGVFKNLTFPSGTVILHSCNGLLLCGNVDWRKPMHQCFVFNPITKQRTKLPHIIGSPPDDYGGSPTIFGINLAFDPLKSPRYKVICIRNCDSYDEGGYQIEIYSSETNGPWRLSGGTFRALSYMKLKEGVFWNGALHWFTCLGACLYFNVDEETIHKLPMPPLPKGTFLRKCYYFGESRGHLHLIEVYNPCTIFNVYEMTRDYSGWFVKYHVDLGEVVNAYPEMAKSNSYQYAVLYVVREENDEDSYMVLHVPKKTIYFSFKNNTFKKIYDFAPPTVGTGTDSRNVLEYTCGWTDAFRYTESLAGV